MGRPKGKIKNELSLQQVVPQLERVLEKKINFLPDCIGNEIKDKINSLENGTIILLVLMRRLFLKYFNDNVNIIPHSQPTPIIHHLHNCPPHPQVLPPHPH